jgi:hypothetical protein
VPIIALVVWIGCMGAALMGTAYESTFYTLVAICGLLIFIGITKSNDARRNQ